MAQVEDVEIGGPGLVKSGGGFVGGGFGARGAIEGMAMAAVLNALATRTSITTIVRIQGTGCELFLLHTRLTPEQLRITMSHPRGAIRSARAAEVAGGIHSQGLPCRGHRSRSWPSWRTCWKGPADPRGIRPNERRAPQSPITGC